MGTVKQFGEVFRSCRIANKEAVLAESVEGSELADRCYGGGDVGTVVSAFSQGDMRASRSVSGKPRPPKS